jgi:hypothetical protein
MEMKRRQELELQRKEIQSAQEEEYRSNAKENDRILKELADAHRLKCLEEERLRAEQAAIDEAKAAIKAEKERRQKEEESRRDAPKNMAVYLTKVFANDNVQISYINCLGEFNVLKGLIPESCTEKKISTNCVADKLRDEIWPSLAKLTSEKKQLHEEKDKLIVRLSKTRFPDHISKSIRKRDKRLVELQEEIKVFGRKQKQLMLEGVICAS